MQRTFQSLHHRQDEKHERREPSDDAHYRYRVESIVVSNTVPAEVLARLFAVLGNTLFRYIKAVSISIRLVCKKIAPPLIRSSPAPSLTWQVASVNLSTAMGNNEQSATTKLYSGTHP